MLRNGAERRDAPGGVLRLVLSPRWMMWHLLTLGAMATCGFLAAWQWRRAGSALGSAVNVGYGLQWPLFAVFFGVVWWRLLRIELTRARDAAPDPAAPGPSGPAGGRPAPPSSGPSPFVHRPGRVPAVSDTDDPELAEYNRMLAALAARERSDHD